MSAVPTLGRVGAPPIVELARQPWDVVVVGAGHNGLTAATYLARAGRRVLVVEARERIGGACTLEETWPGYRVSPCAYLAGLLHPVVLDELGLWRRGLRWIPCDGGMVVPFDDGTVLQLWEDPERRDASIRAVAPGDVAGYRALQALVRRVVDALRPDDDERDLWLGAPPSHTELAARLDDDADALGLVLEWSQAELLDRYLDDERLRAALMGQGIIGTNASPFDPGTASIHLHHSSGRLDRSRPGQWGFIAGGMGMVSFLLHDAAVEAGAVVAAGMPVARILPGEGVALDDGTVLHAPVVVSNADPVATLALLGDDAEPGWRADVEAVPIESATAKVTLALGAPLRIRGLGGDGQLSEGAQLNTPLTDAEWRASFAAASRGELPERIWTEDYVQTTLDPSIAPPGKHLVSVFAQYLPYDLAGGWDTRRAEVGDLAIATLDRYCEGLADAVEHVEVMGPPDIEAQIGLTRGHIFQGECLPGNMWDQRLSPRTPMPGVYLCGAGTYPGGSVMAVNGRNAARAVLDDLGIVTELRGRA